MKLNFLSLFFCLLVVITSKAYGVNIKRNISLDSNFSEKLSEECIKEQENAENTECMEFITLSNYKQVCSNYKSEKCQKFYNDPLSYFPLCKNDPIIKELYQPIGMETLQHMYDLECQKDEDGNLCPMSLSFITSSPSHDVINDTCKSKLCTDSIIEICKKFNIEQFSYYENLPNTSGNFTYEELNAFKNIAKMLESDKCKALHVTNDTSNAINIKSSNILLITLTLLLLLFIY
ncbi:hypothetical protein BCR32DRAFT_324855 [Anaeromyces robustus]|uniref:Uncharacterized protein n=1 Tax=Anaeromyces robustus TaxID=1754192 RepID=A0A1Y1XLT2_9FUNG|nr:hypothetical protein BCR32DRAFT_324855 [Anaeromyces robustus]|eukprot:ORX86655.1 hypothetical protein BCR32DRAFT_324855 [Anaeromyces robustus]